MQDVVDPSREVPPSGEGDSLEFPVLEFLEFRHEELAVPLERRRKLRLDRLVIVLWNPDAAVAEISARVQLEKLQVRFVDEEQVDLARSLPPHR